MFSGKKTSDMVLDFFFRRQVESHRQGEPLSGCVSGSRRVATSPGDPMSGGLPG